jgi:hypothetical protein
MVAVLAAAGLGACGGDSGQEREISRTAREVGATIAALERATARHDYQTICRELFSRAVREQAGGLDCPRRLRRTAGGVRRPRIVVESIAIRGTRAEAEVRTVAAGQAPARDRIELVREGGRWRVAALGG